MTANQPGWETPMINEKTDRKVPFAHPEIKHRLCVDTLPGKRLTIEGQIFKVVGAAWSNARKQMELGLVYAT